MPTLTIKQTYAVARQAGFTPAQAVEMTAIAIAESGLRTDAVGDVNLTTTGERSVGLWQINYRPARDRGNVSRDPSRNLDPVSNAKAAYEISGGGKNFRPWSTFTSGAAARNVPSVMRALGGADPKGEPLPSSTAPAADSAVQPPPRTTAATSAPGKSDAGTLDLALPWAPDVHIPKAGLYKVGIDIGVAVAGLAVMVTGFRVLVSGRSSGDGSGAASLAKKGLILA